MLEINSALVVISWDKLLASFTSPTTTGKKYSNISDKYSKSARVVQNNLTNDSGADQSQKTEKREVNRALES